MNYGDTGMEGVDKAPFLSRVKTWTKWSLEGII